ncbi:MAG: phosphatase PAP2-related protein [Kiritimatiellaeota bacterium]|nr:phosphatase PAP2-related protein [Kiritimatiellota bacterium]
MPKLVVFPIKGTDPAGKSRRGWQWIAAALLLGLMVGLLAVIARAKSAPAGSWQASPAGILTLKGCLVVVSLTAWFWTQALIASRGLKDGQIGDLLHDLTASWNTWLHARPRVASGILIVSSAGIDLFGLLLIGAGVFGPTLRPLIALLLLFAFRQLCQAVCALPAPPRMIWRHPGFPSLLVTYGTGNDFFISGHTAIAVLGAIEAGHLLPNGAWLPVAVVAALEGAVVIVLRAHYTMDVLGAVVAAFCAAGLAGQLCLAVGL